MQGVSEYVLRMTWKNRMLIFKNGILTKKVDMIKPEIVGEFKAIQWSFFVKQL